MLHELYEITTDKDGVREWAFFVVFKGMEPSPDQKPYAKGAWNPEVNHAEGKALYEAGKAEAAWEVERLNRNGRVPPRR